LPVGASDLRARLVRLAGRFYPHAMRPPLIQRIRQHLAAVLVGLLVLVSLEPCAAFARPTPSHPAVQAPADPCRSHHAAAPCACAQLSCQHFAAPPCTGADRVETPSQASFTLAVADALGRTDAPPLPPPRLL
jgi:hypothetical protein